MKTKQQLHQSRFEKASEAIETVKPDDDDLFVDVMTHGNALLEANDPKPRSTIPYADPKLTYDRRSAVRVICTNPWMVFHGFYLPWWGTSN